MSLPEWIGTAGTAIATGAAGFAAAWFGRRKQTADATFTEEQAEAAVWDRWHGEIARLEEVILTQGRKIAAQDQEIDDLRQRLRTYVEGELRLLRTIADREQRIAELQRLSRSLHMAYKVPGNGEGERLDRYVKDELRDEPEVEGSEHD